jgi:hypothetical protein
LAKLCRAVGKQSRSLNGRSALAQSGDREKRQFVPVAPLKGYAAVSDRKEAASPQAQGVAPFEDRDIASLVDDFRDAGHFSSGKFSFKHLPKCRASYNGFLYHLMVYSVFMIEFSNGGSIAFVKSSDEFLTELAWTHEAVLIWARPVSPWQRAVEVHSVGAPKVTVSNITATPLRPTAERCGRVVAS